ncbi:nitrile hydratase subunit beta [Rhodobium gokarnense]|uniref:Nitrile hydratase subunit beta n=1 Tax=Rhodobium gokarnense TaxID=364296 RepID=A0ABT3H6M4_9HYPH|nr:nitrile hydratase subunit beta [Rhodobium gokarnense]MCW2306043.1 nitrile hydratase [Rhodobium gokarnense]
MTTVHDMGGVHGFGVVEEEKDEPMFHAEWERRAFAVTLASAAPGGWSLDESRFARESLPPTQYLTSSYYEIWFAGVVNLLKSRGLVTDAELAAGHALEPPKPGIKVLKAEDVAATLGRGGPTERPATAPARFQVGDRVVTSRANPPTHTRLPRYARGRVGTIHRVHGVHVFADRNAIRAGENPAWLYNVRFEAGELWGPDAQAPSAVHCDLWEPHLEPA